MWLEERGRVIAGMAELPEPRKWDELLTVESPINALVRESPSLMVAKPDGVVSEQNPPPVTSGMLQINVDGGGRFVASKLCRGEVTELLPIAPEVVFQAAGFDFSKFTKKIRTIMNASRTIV